jgi:DNA repair photolyase
MILKAALPLFSSLPSVSEAPAVSEMKFRLRLPRLSPEARLRRAARRGGPVVLGSPAVPYEPDGRSPLAALEGIEGLEIAIVTRSPEIVRELALLADLDRRCSVTVDLIVPAGDAVLAWKLEPDGPAPRERLDAVARLAAEGIAVRVLCPLVAGANDGEPALRKLLAAAREAGAWDVGALPASRPRFLPSLRPQDGDGGATFRRLRLEYGFPRQMAGRG